MSDLGQDLGQDSETIQDLTGQEFDISELESLAWDETGEGLIQDWDGDELGTADLCLIEQCPHFVLKPLPLTNLKV